MASGMTNRGLTLTLKWAFQRASLPTNLFVALVTDATAPNADTNTLSDLTEIAAGNGYTAGGYSLTPDATDFDTLDEDDTGNFGSLKIKDVTWTASSGPIPDSGDGARYAVLTTDEGTVADRQVIAWWDLTSERTLADTEELTLADLELQLQQPA